MLDSNVKYIIKIILNIASLVIKNICENCKIIHHHKTKELESTDDEISIKKYYQTNLNFKKMN